jgi:uncharacterized membrane protein YfcA
MPEFLMYVAVGFAAQMIDGTLGMAYGLSATSFLLSVGLPPVVASATVHAAECVTTGFSALSHHYFENVDRALFRRLLMPGILGAAAGAYVLSNLPGDVLKPYIALYLLLMGVVIIIRVVKSVPPLSAARHVIPLGLFGAFIDAIGGGGWGPIVASTLIAQGNHVRTTVGSVNAVEFFVTLTASLTFLFTIGFSHWQVIAGLAVGGALAAPLAAYACKKVPVKPLMVLVGLLIIGLSIRTLLKSWAP